ncbi:MAG TPA: LysR family transcriptional regulator [Burkholderiaceae bacterium]|nr:LysR family transcriptional regulator [Burkholderiaceae bacterium]
MDLKRLNHLVVLADERNFGRAAERAHLSQSAFSRSVQAAESELGLQLFDRGNLEVSCTAAGAFVIERARKLLFDSRCLARDVDLYRQSLIGDLAFGMGPFPAHTLLPTLLVELRQKYPGVGVRVQVNHWNYLAQNLRREELDFFVADTRDLPLGPDLAVTPLARQHGGFYVRAGHPLLARAKVQARDMVPFGLATVRLPEALLGSIRRLLGLEAQAPLPFALECEDVGTLKSVALATDTVLASTHASVHAEVTAGLLVPVTLDGAPALYAETGLVALRGRSHSPMAQYVLGRLTALTEQMAGLGIEAPVSMRPRAENKK